MAKEIFQLTRFATLHLRSAKFYSWGSLALVLLSGLASFFSGNVFRY